MKFKLNNLRPLLDFLVDAAVRAMENLLGPGTGPEKKARAIEFVMQQVRPVLPDFLEPFVPAVLSLLVDSLVGRYNRSGWPGDEAPTEV